MQDHATVCNILQHHATPSNIMQHHAKPCNIVQLLQHHPTSCNIAFKQGQGVQTMFALFELGFNQWPKLIASLII